MSVQRIFIGDIQGCADELDQIVRKARRRFGREFELWQVGDVVNRGPASLRALERIREHVDDGRGHMVLGNHEIALIEVWLGLRELRPLDTYGDVLDSRDADDWIEWLRRRPLAVTGKLSGYPFAMVHAAVNPKWDLDQLRRVAKRIERRLGARRRSEAEALLKAGLDDDRDADALRRMTLCRSIPARGEWSSSEPSMPRESWHRVWGERKHSYGIVYGHWARQRLHVARGLRGLDTGCVHHGRGGVGDLTAWVPNEDDPRGDKSRFGLFGEKDDSFWQVRARRRYYDVD